MTKGLLSLEFIACYSLNVILINFEKDLSLVRQTPNFSTGIDPKTRHFRITTTVCKTGTQILEKYLYYFAFELVQTQCSNNAR